MYLLCSLFCLLSWPLRGPLWPRVCLLRLLCFLSWPLRGLPWPPRGLNLLTLLPVLAPAWPSVAAAWPYFAHFALVLTPAWPSEAPAWPCFVYFAQAWPSVAATWPYFAHFASCLGPCVSFCGPRMALLRLLCTLSWPLRGFLWPRLALLCSLCFLSWPLRGRGPLRVLLTLLPSLAAGPLRDFCLGLCMAFFGPRVAILCLSLLPLFAPTLCRLRVAFALSVLGPAQPSAAPHGMFGPAWPYLAYLASCLGSSWPSVAFSWPSCTSCLGPCVALRGPSVGITCFAVFHTCATLGLWPVSWLHLVSGRLEPQASAGGEARAWPR